MCYKPRMQELLLQRGGMGLLQASADGAAAPAALNSIANGASFTTPTERCSRFPCAATLLLQSEYDLYRTMSCQTLLVLHNVNTSPPIILN